MTDVQHTFETRPPVECQCGHHADDHAMHTISRPCRKCSCQRFRPSDALDAYLKEFPDA